METIKPAIGKAHTANLPALLALESLFPTDHISRRQFLYHLRNPNAVFLVVREGSHVVGYALFLARTGRAARFYSLIVAPHRQGRGLGRQLCLAGLEILRHRTSAVTLEVDAADSAAIRLYTSLGFHPQYRLEDYYEDGRTALKMKLDF